MPPKPTLKIKIVSYTVTHPDRLIHRKHSAILRDDMPVWQIGNLHHEEVERRARWKNWTKSILKQKGDESTPELNLPAYFDYSTIVFPLKKS